MASHTKMIGLIGEQVLITEFIKNGISVLLPVGDNLPYDIVIEINGIFLKLQVKTTEHITDGKMVFATNITNPYTKVTKKYTESEIDLFGLYCIENNYIGLLPISECTSKETIIRIEPPKNNQKNNIKMATDYLFEYQIQHLI